MPSTQPPNCPKCGKPMTLRTAKSGPFAGKPFYGCSAYPKCKGIVNIDAPADVTQPLSQTNQRSSHQSSLIDLPKVSSKIRVHNSHYTECKSNGNNLQVRLFQNAHALPEVVQEINNRTNTIDKDHLNAFAQWRLDFPISDKNYIQNGLSVFSVIEKILLRGSIATCSPKVEETIERLFAFSLDDIESTITLLQQVHRHPRSCFLQKQFDSNPERDFYQDLLLKHNPQEIYPWVSAQVPVSCLTRDLIPAESKQRIDFLLATPTSTNYVVEIDGPQHEDQVLADQQRDNSLSQAGCQVTRFQTKDLNRNNNLKKDHIQGLINSIVTERPFDLSEEPLLEALLFTKAASQFQITLLEALKNGDLDFSNNADWKIKVIPPGWISNLDKWNEILQCALVDFTNLATHVFHLHTGKQIIIKTSLVMREGSQDDLSLIIRYGWLNAVQENIPVFSISDIYLPFSLAFTSTTADPLSIKNPCRSDVEYLLNFIFRKEEFLEGQWEAIDRTLQGKDSILLLPTGGGKSIAFQLAAFLLPGVCLVIDPLIALIDDQLDNLRSYGIDRAVGITSQLTSEEKTIALNLFSRGNYLFCYVAPERFQMKEFRSALRGLTVHSPICLIAIDETHCVSEWGHDFRVSYLNIARNARNYAMTKGVIPPLLGLTGTASRSVLRDVRRELEITEFDSVITPQSFDRGELNFTIYECLSKEKTERLLGVLSALPQRFGISPNNFYQPNSRESNTGLIFYPHVNGEYGVLDGYEKVREHVGSDIGMYSGKAPKNFRGNNWDEMKSYFAEKFKKNELTILTCTNAFGMGIDKPNIRFTIHMNLPSSIENFYQEAGRAGRDRKRAECCLIVSNDHPKRSRTLLDPNTPLEVISREIDDLTYGEDDDVTRTMYFHVTSFRGAEEEFQQVKKLIAAIGDIEVEKNFKISYTEDTKVLLEKAVHRLLIIGVVKDYTIDYSSNEIELSVSGSSPEENLSSYLRYLSNYDKKLATQAGKVASEQMELPHVDFVLFLAQRLIEDFIYNILELSRRRSLSEMLQACITNPTDEGIRARILSYLQLGHYSELLENARENLDDLIGIIDDLLDEVDSPLEAAELRGQSARMLEAYPNNPSLLLIRSFAEVYCTDRNEDVVFENFKAFISFSTSERGWGNSKEEVMRIGAQFIQKVSETNESLAQDLTVLLLHEVSADRNLTRLLIPELGENVALYPMYLLVSNLSENINKII